jgi:saccharopine dehydrogenase-like NADP-dependent oxidoreductase
MEVQGVRVRPIDVTAKLLFPKWKLMPGEKEFTVMRIRIEGEEKGLTKRYEYNLLDHTNTLTDTLSMARTTGYTCTAAAHLILDGTYSRIGISPPEYIGEDENNFRRIMDHLKMRGVHYDIQEF